MALGSNPKPMVCDDSRSGLGVALESSPKPMVCDDRRSGLGVGLRSSPKPRGMEIRRPEEDGRGWTLRMQVELIS